jgi:hypothetical protein
MAKKIVLPRTAFKMKGEEIVGGHRFTNGELVLSDEDANRIFRKFVNFYGCTVEDVPQEQPDEDDDDDKDPSLSSNETK